MHAVTPHAFTDYMYLLHYLHVLLGEVYLAFICVICG